MSRYVPSSVAVTLMVLPVRPAPFWPSPVLSWALHLVTLPSNEAARESPLWPVPPGSTALAGLATHGRTDASRNAAPTARTRFVLVDRFMAAHPDRDEGPGSPLAPRRRIAGAMGDRIRLRITASPSSARCG